MVGGVTRPTGLDGLLLLATAGQHLAHCYGRPLVLRMPSSILPDPFTTGLADGEEEEEKLLLSAQLLDSLELPAAARIQQEPNGTTGNEHSDASDNIGDGSGVELDGLAESGDFPPELYAKDTIFYENITIPESEHDNVVPTGGEGERAGLPKHGGPGHGGHRGREEEEDAIRRRRRHGHR